MTCAVGGRNSQRACFGDFCKSYLQILQTPKNQKIDDLSECYTFFGLAVREV
jgi:hypothetical protein